MSARRSRRQALAAARNARRKHAPTTATAARAAPTRDEAVLDLIEAYEALYGELNQDYYLIDGVEVQLLEALVASHSERAGIVWAGGSAYWKEKPTDEPTA